MRIVVPILLLLISLLSAQAQEAGVRRYFDDWLAACRSDGYCSAIGYVNPNPGDGRVADYWFRIGRHAEESYWELSFTPIKVMADPAQPFTITVDDAAETFLGIDEIAPYGAINDFFLLGKKAQAVMDRMMPGTALSVSFTDETGAPEDASFSLKGLTAALIWIDERQKRLGSERVAELPPQGLAPAYDLPAPSVLDPTTVRLVNLHNDSSNCSVPIDEETFNRVWRAELDATHSLFVVPCEEFSYNFIGALYIVTEFEVTPAIVPGSDTGTGALANTVYSASWDDASATLFSAYKGGNGNCGSAGKWRWTSDQFELIEFRARETCDDTAVEWPIVAGGPGN